MPPAVLLMSTVMPTGAVLGGDQPSGSRYLRLVFANEPAERLTDLRARFDSALS